MVVTTPNTVATGQPTIAGTTEVGETLTAGTSAIDDANGLTNAVPSAYQWVRSANGSDTDISGATGSTYTVTNADIDKAIKIRVSFTDDDGYSETLTSNATTSVPVPAPVIVPPQEPQIAQAAGDDGETLVLDTWSLIPSGLKGGDSFRLLFLSSTTRNGSSSSIGTYNTFVQNRATAGHDGLADYASQFKVVGSTADTDARDNTETTGTGVPIYWVNGNKLADGYSDFYDGSWDDETNIKDESGEDRSSPLLIFTGSDNDGTESFVGSRFTSPRQERRQDGPTRRPRNRQQPPQRQLRRRQERKLSLLRSIPRLHHSNPRARHLEPQAQRSQSRRRVPTHLPLVHQAQRQLFTASATTTLGSRLAPQPAMPTSRHTAMASQSSAALQPRMPATTLPPPSPVPRRESPSTGWAATRSPTNTRISTTAPGTTRPTTRTS